MQATSPLVLYFIALLLCGCDKSSRNSEPPKPATNPPASEVVVRDSPPTPEPVAKNFNAQIPALPSDFAPDSPTAVYDAMSGLDTNKGKYESEAKYMERMRALARTVLYGEVTLNGSFAFRPISDAVSISYDADREIFSYEVHSTCLGDSSNCNCNGIEIDRRGASHAEFPSINEYFAAKYKAVHHRKSVYLQIQSLKGLGHINGKFKAKPAVAQELDGSLGVLLVGHIVPPYAYHDVKYPFEPSDDLVEHRRIIRFAVDGVWFINLRSGEILSRTWAVKRLA